MEKKAKKATVGNRSGLTVETNLGKGTKRAMKLLPIGKSLKANDTITIDSESGINGIVRIGIADMFDKGKFIIGDKVVSEINGLKVNFWR